MNNINVFDFDGVLCDCVEDSVFRLPTSAMDVEFIEAGRERYNITKLSDNTARNRHIILQEVLYERNLCPEPGPYYEKFREATDPFYILTSRAGPGAVARVCQFFETQDQRPEEMFFVGPVSKNHMLIDICEKYPDFQITFYDDTPFHLEAAKELGYQNLHTVHINNNPEHEDQVNRALDFYTDQNLWLQRA